MPAPGSRGRKLTNGTAGAKFACKGFSRGTEGLKLSNDNRESEALPSEQGSQKGWVMIQAWNSPPTHTHKKSYFKDTACIFKNPPCLRLEKKCQYGSKNQHHANREISYSRLFTNEKNLRYRVRGMKLNPATGCDLAMPGSWPESGCAL